MAEEDVERFLWDLEKQLAHLDGDERRDLVREAEQRLQELATAIAGEQGDERVDWYHYVQATAELGPPERLARELTGRPLPDTQASNRRLWIAAGIMLALIVTLSAYAWFTTGELTDIGTWSGTEEQATRSEMVTFNVTEEADSVFLRIDAGPTNAQGVARVLVLDGQASTVWEGQATVQEHLEEALFLEGEPGQWRIIVDFQSFTGSWRLEALQEAG